MSDDVHIVVSPQDDPAPAPDAAPVVIPVVQAPTGDKGLSEAEIREDERKRVEAQNDNERRFGELWDRMSSLEQRILAREQQEATPDLAVIEEVNEKPEADKKPAEGAPEKPRRKKSLWGW